jgi:hypothetical protein
MRQAEPSIVFNSMWIQGVEKRYGHRSRALKSWPYLIATDCEFSSIRQQIENWVAGLSETERRKTIPNLHSRDNFWHAYHELAVGNFLKKLGLQTEFEKRFDEQTPDWFACSGDGSQSFMVEVLTANVPESIDSENKRLDDLTLRLGEIPLDFLLRISCGDNSVVRQLDPQRSKRIARAVRMWLQIYNWQSKPRLCLNGFVFEVVQRNCGFPTVQYIRPAKGIYAAWTPLCKKIKEKVHKYKNLVTANKIPLVVAVAPGLETYYSNFEIKKILFGKVSVESPSGDGLFHEEPLLSGAFFIGLKGVEWTINHYSNPQAIFPLPENIFGKGSYAI